MRAPWRSVRYLPAPVPLALTHLPVPEPLSTYVAELYILRGEVAGPLHDILFAHGALELVVNVGLCFDGHRARPASEAKLIGQIIRPVPTALSGAGFSFGAVLRPAGVAALLGRGAQRLNDRELELERLPAASLQRALRPALERGDFTRAAEVLLASFERGLRADRRAADHARLVARAVSALEEYGHAGAGAVASVDTGLGVSTRLLTRAFRQQVGLSVSPYRRIRRFDDAVHRLRARRHTRLTDLAYSSGYFDQAHFNRDVRYFTGHAPRSLQALARPLAEVYA